MKLYPINDKCVKIMQERLADEYKAERFYKCASTWCDLNGFKEASDYFVDEYHEERRHEHKIEKNLTDWGIVPSLPAVAAAQPAFNDIVDIINQAYEMEYALCEAYQKAVLDVQNEYPSCAIFFNKFVKIQNESVISYAGMIKKLEGITGVFELQVMSKKLFK